MYLCIEPIKEEKGRTVCVKTWYADLLFATLYRRTGLFQGLRLSVLQSRKPKKPIAIDFFKFSVWELIRPTFRINTWLISTLHSFWGGDHPGGGFSYWHAAYKDSPPPHLFPLHLTISSRFHYYLETWNFFFFF